MYCSKVDGERNEKDEEEKQPRINTDEHGKDQRQRIALVY
jgi:hypothetical protein